MYMSYFAFIVLQVGSSLKSSEKGMVMGALSKQQNSSQSEEKERGVHFSPLAQFKQEHESSPGGQNCIKEDVPPTSSLKTENIVSNVAFSPTVEDRNGNPAHASTSFIMGGDFKCDKCECSFPSSDLLIIHQAVHVGRSFHVCKVCNAMFLLKADLNRHWTTHPNIKQHICQLCGKAYTSKNNYKLHIKTHTGVGLYPCEVCGKAFHSENHLNVHRRIHTGERPYECQYCDKSFTQKSGLINHTRLHTGEKPFLCPSCPKAFTQKSNLNFHLSKHHPVPGDAVPVSLSKHKSIPGDASSPDYESSLRGVQPSPHLLSVPVEVSTLKTLSVNGDRPFQDRHSTSANLLS